MLFFFNDTATTEIYTLSLHDALPIFHFAVTVKGLNPRIGLYRTEYVQPMDYEPLSTGGFHGDLVRNAEPVQQEDSLTEWVSQVMLRETAIEPVSIPPVTLAQLGKSAKKAQKISGIE